MCGRFNLIADAETLAEHFALPAPPPVIRPRYNIAPTQSISVVALQRDRVTRGLAQIPWGIVPEWADNPARTPRVFNARAESVAFKFGRCLRERRVLIPASGFYEWRAVGKKKAARLFAVAGGEPFAFAGLWDVWGEGSPGKIVAACMITTKPNPLVAEVHDRMPAILPRDHYAEWLDPGTGVDRLLGLLRPYPAELMTARDVGPAVNSSKHDSPACVAAV